MVDYLNYWQAKAPVFTSAPDTDALYFSEELKHFADRMRTGFSQGLSVMSLSGAIGCGKSTLLRWIYDTLDPDRFEVLMVVLFKSETTSGWLIPRLASMLGSANIGSASASNNATTHGSSYVAHLEAIGQRLDEIKSEGRRLVILVDSCERIQTPAALEEVSALVDAHLSGSSVVSILLVGSNEFQNEMLGHQSGMGSALASRVGWRDKLPSLSVSHVPSYIVSRLKESGISPDLFSAEAADIAARLSNSNLHLLNSLCENALVDAAEAELKQVNIEAVQRAAKFILHSHMQVNSQRPNSAESSTQKKKPKPIATSTKDKLPDNEANVPLQSLFKPKSDEKKKQDK